MPCWVWALRIGSVGASRQQDDSLLSRKVGWPWICSSPSVQPQAGPWPVATTPAANLLVGVVCDLHVGEHGHGAGPVLHGHVIVSHLHERHRPAMTMGRDGARAALSWHSVPSRHAVGTTPECHSVLNIARLCSHLKPPRTHQPLAMVGMTCRLPLVILSALLMSAITRELL